METFEFKFDEDEILNRIRDYVKKTYGEHYVGKRNVQTIESIFDSGNGKGFVMGNIQKLSARYGKKGGYNVDDLFKIAHYAILALYVHQMEQSEFSEMDIDIKKMYEDIADPFKEIVVDKNGNYVK